MNERLPARKPILSLLMRLLVAAAFVAPAFHAQAGAILTSLHSFDSRDGINPYGGLVQGTDGFLYGTTYSGGNNGVDGAGTVFKISTGGSFSNLVQFDTTDGAAPVGGLVQGIDGLFYGTTFRGGTNTNSYGTVFQVSSNGALNSLYSFGGTQDYLGIPLDGGLPEAPLVQASNGVFYGTCRYGGTNDNYPDGTIFEIGSNGGFTIAWSFTGASDGGAPEAGLVQGSDGNFYGTTFGDYGADGGVFKFTPPQTVTGLHTFSGDDGANPYGGLVEGSDGNFYGTTTAGGAYTNGTVFKISSGGAFSNLYSFTGGNDGASPYGVLVQGGDGYFYGTTASGGAHTNGTLFRISSAGALTNLYSFTGGDDGGEPYAGLVQASDGNFYGETLMGGTNGYGTVFRMTIVPEFQTVALNNGWLILSWFGVHGGLYQLQYVSDLGSTNWTDLGSPFTTNGAILSASDPITNGLQRFYRLVFSP
ncbi:MAG TPA: choice-of-anchor tandem repeat GloVer-containing protein [Verrucomicrobiae bacterium]|jgi:uncharacterized repeat protein (TIGR03803 family)|nr:choice-of-anchor tandem repeat GloVer-containing protein [Verrucomicrobiae bacterium]